MVDNFGCMLLDQIEVMEYIVLSFLTCFEEKGQHALLSNTEVLDYPIFFRNLSHIFIKLFAQTLQRLQINSSLLFFCFEKRFVEELLLHLFYFLFKEELTNGICFLLE